MGEVGITIAVALVVDHSRNLGIRSAVVIEDPERIRRFIDSCTQSSMFAQTLQDGVLSSLALVHSPVIGSRGCIIDVGAESEQGIISAPDRVDLVVPSGDVEVPFLRALVRIVNAEIIVSALEIASLVDAAAAVRRSLGVRNGEWIHTVVSVGETHGAGACITSLIVVNDDIFHAVALLGRGTTIEAVVARDLSWVDISHINVWHLSDGVLSKRLRVDSRGGADEGGDGHELLHFVVC